jgi:adenine nucleotide transporter 17
MIQHIYNEEGVQGFFKGVFAGVALTVNPIISFIIYEAMRVRLIDEKGDISGINIIIMSLVSKLVATIFTYPMLTVKTLLQANEKLSTKKIVELIKDLYNREGITGLYKG